MKLKYVILFVFLFIISINSLTLENGKNLATEGMQNGESNSQFSKMSEMQPGMIPNEMLPLQQPVLLAGGSLPALNVFHNPVWMSGKPEENQTNQMNIERLSMLNKQLDEELSRYKPLLNGQGQGYNPNYSNYQNQANDMKMNKFAYPKFMQVQTESEDRSTVYPSKLNGVDLSKIKDRQLDFLGQDSRQKAPICIRREGMLKIRDVDQKDRDVVVTYAVLTKERLSYFVNAKDETSIQGSIELGKIKESLKLINGFPTCFTIKTIDGVSDCSICAESEDSAREWINAITQNAVNCNTLSALNNLNKRGLLK